MRWGIVGCGLIGQKRAAAVQALQHKVVFVADAAPERAAALARGLEPRLTYSGGDRGWVGDNPFIFLDARRIHALGWRPKFGIQQSVECTVDWLKANEWVFSNRTSRGSQR